MQVRLLDESIHFGARAAQGFARLDIAETGLGPRWFNAKGHEPALLSELPSVGDCSGKGSLILDQMVGRHDKDYGVLAVPLVHVEGCGAYRRRRIATNRF